MRWVPALGVAAVVLALAAACGGDDGGSDSSNPASNNANDGQNAFAAYRQCLQDNGVTLPSMRAGRPSGAPSGAPSGRPGRPGGNGGIDMGKPDGVDDATWQKAQEACASLRPTGGPGGGGDDRGATAAYRNCLLENGVTAIGAGATADPKFAEADKVCAALRPTSTPN